MPEQTHPLVETIIGMLNLGTAYVVVLWFAAGFLLATSRRLTLSVTVPILVAGLPLIVGVDAASATITTLPMGTDAALWLSTLIVPLMASIAGGHACIVINPLTRARMRTQTAWDQARERAEHVAREISDIELQFEGIRSRMALNTDSETVGVMRLQLDGRRAELRELGRQIAQSA